MKSTVEQMFDAYVSEVESLGAKIEDRNAAFASFVAGVIITSRVIGGSKTHEETTKIIQNLMIECENVAVDQITAILTKGSSAN